MATLEELEKRVERLESLYHEVLDRRLLDLSARIERSRAESSKELATVKTELIERMEQNKTELIERIERSRAESSKELAMVKTELIERMERMQRTLIYNIAMMLMAFGAFLIAAIWALITFALK